MMRIDFVFAQDEILTAYVDRKDNIFSATCNSVTSKGKSIDEAIKILKGNLRRHFLKLRCKNALNFNPIAA